MAQEEPATPLSNSDFRKLLTTPRRDQPAAAPTPMGGFAKPKERVLTEADKKKREKAVRFPFALGRAQISRLMFSRLNLLQMALHRRAETGREGGA